MTDEILAAARRILNAMHLADDSLDDFEADVQLVAEAVVERAETEGRLRAALERLVGPRPGILTSESDMVTGGPEEAFEYGPSVYVFCGGWPNGDYDNLNRGHAPDCPWKNAEQALAPAPAPLGETVNGKNEVCGCGDLPISHASGPCIINGCECPGYTSWRNMPEWWHRDHGVMRPLAPPTVSAAPHDAGEGA